MGICLLYAVPVVGAGGIYDGRGLAMALSYGADAVWIGTRFVATHEAGASMGHKEAILSAEYETARPTLVYSGRPLRTLRNEYVAEWEGQRAGEMKRLLEQGIVPRDVDKENRKRQTFGYQLGDRHFAGVVAGSINDIKFAKDVVHEMMTQCIQCLKRDRGRIRILSKL